MSIEKTDLEKKIEETTKNREKVIGEIQSTEAIYLQDIEFLDNFIREIEKSTAETNLAAYRFKQTEEGKTFIAGMQRIRPIKIVSQSLYRELDKAPIDSLEISKIFLAEEQNFNDYIRYVESHAQTLALCISLKENNKAFKLLANEFEKNDQAKGLTLEAFLITPVHRLSSYKLLLTELQKTEDKLETLQKIAQEDSKKEKTPLSSSLDKSIQKVHDAALFCNAAREKPEILAAWTKALSNQYSSSENRAIDVPVESLTTDAVSTSLLTRLPNVAKNEKKTFDLTRQPLAAIPRVMHRSDPPATTIEKDQTYQTFEAYCGELSKNLGSRSLLSKGENSLVIPEHKISVICLQDNSINTSLPDALAELEKVFPIILAANIKAGLTSLSPKGPTISHIEYMTKEILKKALTPMFDNKTEEMLKTHGFKDGESFIANIQEKIALEKLPTHHMGVSDSENAKEPFDQYTKLTMSVSEYQQKKQREAQNAPPPLISSKLKKKKPEGKQEKAPDSGFYEKEGKLYYIKKSQEFPADDIAEVATSHLLTLAITEKNAVMYEAVRHQKFKNSVYLVSEVSFQTLKEQVVLPEKTYGADLRTKPNKDAVYKRLQDSKAEKEMARVLAGCLWVDEPDSQYGNTLLGPNGEVKKFDNGWGLVDICKKNHARVRLFEKKSPVGATKGTHVRKLKLTKGIGAFFAGAAAAAPTNHFNDYPDIIRSQHFVEALEEILDNITPANIDAEAVKIVDRIKADYKNAEPNSVKALKLFAKHIGLSKSKKPRKQAMDEFIKDSLKKRLKERADSMAVLRCLLKIDLALNDTAKPLSSQEAERLVKELQDVISSRFTIANGYSLDKLKIRNIIPPYNPPRDKLMKELINIVGKDSVQKNNVVKFCELLSKGGKQKSVNELLATAHNVALENEAPSVAKKKLVEPVGAEKEEKAPSVAEKGPIAAKQEPVTESDPIAPPLPTTPLSDLPSQHKAPTTPKPEEVIQEKEVGRTVLEFQMEVNAESPDAIKQAIEGVLAKEVEKNPLGIDSALSQNQPGQKRTLLLAFQISNSKSINPFNKDVVKATPQGEKPETEAPKKRKT